MSDSTRAQEHRRDNQDIIIPLLHEYTPNFPTVIANKIAFQLHMSPWTIRYNYLPMFEDAGLLIKLENGMYAMNGVEIEKEIVNTVQKEVVNVADFRIAFRNWKRFPPQRQKAFYDLAKANIALPYAVGIAENYEKENPQKPKDEKAKP